MADDNSPGSNWRINDAHQHPYQLDIPEKYRHIQRWYLLDTKLDPPRPWNEQTNLPVFSLALVLGLEGNRRWLLYAHSPLEDRPAVEIMVPGYGITPVDVPREGACFAIQEQGRRVTELAGLRVLPTN